MPRLINRNPTYRLHRPSGQAVVTLNGDDVYLGIHNTKDSRAKYDQVISEWLARGRQHPGQDADRRVNDVIKAYWDHARDYFGAAGKPELGSIKAGLAILRRAYGDEPARTFGPLALQVVREKMVEVGWSRGYVNAQVNRIKRCFKWACSRELIAPSVYQGLLAIDGLRHGKTDARETEPVKPVPEPHVEAILSHVSRQIGGMIRLQFTTGMRPGELCILRGSDIDTTGKVWVYRPQRHKTAHRKHERTVFLGPKGQAIVEEFLKPDTQAYLFSPQDAEAERRAAMHAARKTPLSCGNTPGSNQKRARERAPSVRYTVASYRRAIARGCDEAFPPPTALQRIRVKGGKKNAMRWETRAEWGARLGEKAWEKLQKWESDHRWHPHQLRHNAATRIRKQYGLEAARVVLGHRSGAVAEIYAEIDQNKARDIMGEVG